jgi:hypothetical protein
VPAFDAWLAQRPFTNRDAIPGPLYMPQYRPAGTARARRLDAAADALYEEGTEAKANGWSLDLLLGRGGGMTPDPGGALIIRMG